MIKLNLFKKKDKKRFIGRCPVKNEDCFIATCCAGCNELKTKKQYGFISEIRLDNILEKQKNLQNQ